MLLMQKCTSAALTPSGTVTVTVSGAVMTALRRTFACGYTLDDCITLDELKALAADYSAEVKRLRKRS